MIVKKIIEKLRNKGYDDFYLADFVDKHEQGIFFFILVLQALVIAIPIIVMKFLLGEQFLPVWVIICCFLVFPFLLYAVIQDEKKKGETELRMTYIISSTISKLCLKTIRYAPFISVILLVVFLIYAIIQYGFHMKMIMVFATSLLLLLIIARPYHKLLSRVMKNAVYYVDWKTHQIVENFEDIYSGHEKWWMSSSEMDFEQFNVWYFRNICQTAFVSVSIGCLAGLIYAVSFSPMCCMYGYNKLKTGQTEQLFENTTSEEVETSQALTIPKESEDVQNDETYEEDVEDMETYEEEVVDVKDQETREEDVEDVEKVEEVEDVNEKIIDKQEEEVRTKRYEDSELEEKIYMNDGGNIRYGVRDYLKKHIPILADDMSSLRIIMYISSC